MRITEGMVVNLSSTARDRKGDISDSRTFALLIAVGSRPFRFFEISHIPDQIRARV